MLFRSWLVAADAEVAQSDALEADIVWMHDAALEPGRLYDFKIGTQEIAGKVAAIDYQIDVNTLEHHEATSLPLNAIGRCRIELTASVPLDDYRKSPGTGSFVVIDRLTNITVGAGLIRGAAEGAADDSKQAGEVDWQAFEIDFNALIRKHFPHWEAKDVKQLFHN